MEESRLRRRKPIAGTCHPGGRHKHRPSSIYARRRLHNLPSSQVELYRHIQKKIFASEAAGSALRTIGVATSFPGRICGSTSDQERSDRRSAPGARVGLGRSDLPTSTTLAWGSSPCSGFTFSTSAPRLRTILAAIVKHIVRYSFVPSSTKTTHLSRRSFRPFVPLPKPRFCSIDSAWF